MEGINYVGWVNLSAPMLIFLVENLRACMRLLLLPLLLGLLLLGPIWSDDYCEAPTIQTSETM